MVEGFQGGDGDLRVDVPDGAANGWREGSCGLGAADEESDAPPGTLPVGDVDHGRGVVELVDAGVGQDADDGEFDRRVVCAEDVADGVGIGKDGAGCVLGDEDVGGVVLIVGREVAAGEEGDAEGGGVAGADPADVGGGLVAGGNGVIGTG